MYDFFKDNLRESSEIIGGYDENKDLYNLTLNGNTISFSEDAKGWTGRKSFLPESSISLNGIYYSFNTGSLWRHSSTAVRNNFYGIQYPSTVKFILNEAPDTIKTFKTLSYEGTKDWLSNSVETESQSGEVTKF